jgi:hypothetical protein
MFESAHIPGAYNVPLDKFGEHAYEQPPHLSVPVMTACASPEP